MVDISNPAQPHSVGSADSPGETWGIAIVGVHAYLADSPFALRVFDVSNPTTPVLVGSLEMQAAFFDVVGSGTYVYTSSLAHGVAIAPAQCSQ